MVHWSGRITNIAATTLEHIKKDIADNVYDMRAYLRYLKTKGHIKRLDGGRMYYCPVAVAPGLSAWYYPADAGTPWGGNFTKTLDDNQVLAAEYTWHYLYGHLSIDGSEEMQNMGKMQAVDVVKGRVDLVKEQLADQLNSALYDWFIADAATYPADHYFHALNVIAPDNGQLEASGEGVEAGGLAFADYAAWESNDVNAQADYSDLAAKMLELWMDMYDDGAKIDLIIMHPDVYEAYETIGANNAKFMDHKLIDLGFQQATYKGVPIITDPECKDGSDKAGARDECLYMLDHRHLGMFVHNKREIAAEPFRRSEVSVDAWFTRFYWMGNMWCNNRRRQGVISFSE